MNARFLTGTRKALLLVQKPAVVCCHLQTNPPLFSLWHWKLTQDHDGNWTCPVLNLHFFLLKHPIHTYPCTQSTCREAMDVVIFIRMQTCMIRRTGAYECFCSTTSYRCFLHHFFPPKTCGTFAQKEASITNVSRETWAEMRSICSSCKLSVIVVILTDNVWTSPSWFQIIYRRRRVRATQENSNRRTYKFGEKEHFASEL